MIEHAAWLLPKAKETYAHRDEILKGSKWLYNYVLSKNKQLAFTGHAGVGKTVLFDYITSKAYVPGYTPPGESQGKEKKAISAARKRMHLVTVPGQDSQPRHEAISQLFTEKNTVDGVIHVVANGFVELRSDVARQFHLDQQVDTIEKFRKLYLAAELKDLADTCRIIRESVRRHRRPKWLLVAVAKVDLYYLELLEAQKYYSPETDTSPFAHQLNELAAQVGRDNFRWNAAPVCCWLDDFVWNQEKVASSLKVSERDHYVAKFIRSIQDLC